MSGHPSERGYRQFVPRPAASALHDAPQAAFAQLGTDRLRAVVTWPSIERAFAPGGRDQAPPGGREDQSPPGVVEAAVLVPLLDDGGEPSVVLIRRGSHLRASPGELAFPGGRIEPGETPLEAALREAEEEVGLPGEAVRVLGALPPVVRGSSSGEIAAFVGAIGRASGHATGPVAGPTLAPNPDEVDAVLVEPLAELADPSRYWEESWARPDGSIWRMPFFHFGDDVLWGASARIVVFLLDLLAAPR